VLVKNTQTGRILVLDVNESEFVALAHARRSMPRLRVEARTQDLKRLFLVAFADLEPVHTGTSSDLNGLAARSVS
jgi:hypothetical protein